MSIEEAIKILDYKINMYKEDVFIGDLDKTNIEAIKKVLKEIERLQEENYKLQKCLYEEELDVQDQNRELGIRIDKAIEYIESNPLVFYGEEDYYVNDIIAQERSIGNVKFIKTLLQILKGEDNE